MKCVICDDDKVYAKTIIAKIKGLQEHYNEEFEFVYYEKFEQIEADFVAYKNDKKAPNKALADIYFLDIEFGEVIGMDVAKLITKYNKNAGIVYITNYEDYAIKAFVCRPIGFIRKKHDEEDILITMDKVVAFYNDKNFLYTFMDNKSSKVVNLSTVTYIEMSNHNMCIYTGDDNFVNVRDKLLRVENDIQKQGFVKVNRSCLINMNYIKNIEDSEVILEDGNRFYITGNKEELITREWQAYIMGY